VAFYESPAFPRKLAYGLHAGPGYATDVLRLKSGSESRNQNWSLPLHVFDGSTTARTQAERDEIDAFFRAMRGRTHGFRLFDPGDNAVTTSGTDGIVTLISGSSYQLYKRYTSGAQSSDRKITKPVSGSTTIAGGGTYSLDTTTGIITHSGGAAPTGWTGSFDVPVRFDHDELRWSIVDRAGGGYIYVAEQLRMVELRG
jgi:uncharacterized protein (TIGR02217 family)